MSSINCPDCKETVSLEKAEIGDIVECDNCGCELELLKKDPPEIRVIEEEK
ncbi:MAG TPA: lysine biosynthesis protein LysW [Candidatus Peregrinibacteria bacterium]|nr:lysine biosynthesis protein LysW [Candidatus Peregrinibacteria bacterium]